MQLLAGTVAGRGARGHVGGVGEFCCSAPQHGRDHRGRREVGANFLQNGKISKMLCFKSILVSVCSCVFNATDGSIQLIAVDP